jgi:pyruvate kinase
MLNIPLQLDYVGIGDRIRRDSLQIYGPMEPTESVASSAVKTAWDTKATLIVVLTESGKTARLIAKYRPSMPVLVITDKPETARQCEGYVKNCRTQVITCMQGTEAILQGALKTGKSLGWCKPGDNVVCVHGTSEGSEGSTNLLRVLIVGN